MASPSPTFAKVLDVYFKHRLPDLYADAATCERIERAMRQRILRLQREGMSYNAIYLDMEDVNAALGHPYVYYEDFMKRQEEAEATAKKAQQKASRDATAAQKAASTEFANKRKCVELEQKVRNKQIKLSSTTTATTTSSSWTNPGVRVGSFVSVSADLSRPGVCFHGGCGFVQAVDGDGPRRTFTVKYNESSPDGGKTEHGIPYSRITEVPCPFTAFKASRNRKSPENFGETHCLPKVTPEKPALAGIHSILTDGYQRNRGRGWRAKDLGVFDLGSRNEQFQSLLVEDARELKGYLAVAHNKHNKRGLGGLFKKAKGKYNPISMKYLAAAWDVGLNTATNLLKKRAAERASPNNEPKPDSPVHLSVIDSLEAAKAKYTPKSLYISSRIRERSEQDEVFAYDSGSAERINFYREEAKAEWVGITHREPEVVAYWEMQVRSKLERQPFIRDQIIESLRENPAKSFDKVSEDIGHWCSSTTIQRWISSHSGYATYAERALPLLSTAQKAKHVQFSKHLLNNWGLPRDQKILWVNYDEKWFMGWVSRCNAKMCEILGLDKSHTYLKHKCHINKVMVAAFTAYAFKGNPENGGDGVKIGIFRVQGARIAKKDVRESRRDEDGKLKYDGKIVRMKGDAYLVDCNVTGSDEGTSDKPKFALLALYRDHVFPEIARLTGPGGRYEGYLPVFQGDNAGPHIDAAFLAYVENFCREKGWRWEPQAPQMPHMNNLDLAVFPMMSKRHSTLLRHYSNMQAPHDEIWDATNSVWNNMESAQIARGFVLAYRIARKVIQHKGDNAFLQKQDFHSGVRDDFYATATGIAKKTHVLDS